MKAKKRSRQSPTAISVHESAHFVLTHLLCPTHFQTEIPILKRDETLGRVTGESIDGIESPSRKVVENEVVTLYAGYIAEILICGTKPSFARLGAQCDFDVADHVLRNFTPVRGAGLIQLKARLRARTKTLVKKYRHLIEYLAKELRREKAIPGEEAGLIIEIARGKKEAVWALTSVRDFRTSRK